MNPFENKKLSIFEFSKYSKIFVVENQGIIVKANEIIKKGVKRLDALHLACAIIAKVDCFITVDDGILKHATNEIMIFDPIAFIKYWENQEVKND